MDMDTDALRWLQQVADGTTVTEVSDTEAVTQSGVSRAWPGWRRRSARRCCAVRGARCG